MPVERIQKTNAPTPPSSTSTASPEEARIGSGQSYWMQGLTPNSPADRRPPPPPPKAGTYSPPPRRGCLPRLGGHDGAGQPPPGVLVFGRCRGRLLLRSGRGADTAGLHASLRLHDLASFPDRAHHGWATTSKVLALPAKPRARRSPKMMPPGVPMRTAQRQAPAERCFPA